MRTKDVERKIQKWCEQYEKDYLQFIVGYGKTANVSKHRYEFNIISKKHNCDTTKVKYVVKYFEYDEMYIVWPFRYDVYSVDSFEADNAFNISGKVTKNIEYPNWGEEDVLIFNEEKMESFIKNLD